MYLCNGRPKAVPNLLVPVRSSIPLYRVGLYVVKTVCEIIAEIELAARFLRWISTHQEIFGLGSQGGSVRGFICSVSGSGGVSTPWFLLLLSLISYYPTFKRIRGLEVGGI